MMIAIDMESILAFATSVCTTSFIVSTVITNFFDTPDPPDIDDGLPYKVWFYIYRTAETIRCINDRAKQRPDIAAMLKRAVDKHRSEELSPEEMMKLIEDLAYTVGTKRALEKSSTPPVE